MNAGERDEIIFKLKLIQMRDANEPLFGVPITNVGFYQEYYSLPKNYTLSNPNSLNDNQLLKLASFVGISKAPASAKSDVYINHEGVSIKSHSSAPAALVNHTVRPGFEFACQNANLTIATLDSIIDEYWNLRLAGRINEDTKISDRNCPFKEYKHYLKPILEYFLFTGTGSKISDNKASYLIEFNDPLDIKTYSKLTPSDAVDAIWPKLIFSLRKKGMPSNYHPETYTGKNAKSIKRWVRYINNEYKGTLHIRASKK